MESQLKERLKARTTWVRGLYMLLFAVLCCVAGAVLAVVVLFQFGSRLITGGANSRLLEFSGMGVFCYHGYTEFRLEGKRERDTGRFNLALCTKFRVKPLEFDGRNDSIFHPYDEDARRHMEYVRDRGSFADVPAAQIQQAFREFYPRLYGLGREAARERFG